MLKEALSRAEAGFFEFTAMLDGDGHHDVVRVMGDKGFKVTCLNEETKNYRFEWRK